MSFWAWVLVWLAVFAAITKFRDWLWRRKDKPSHRVLYPSVWRKDVLGWYKHNATRRTL